ncbi:hypothetical protein PVK06_035547 [Gossypium arboreum]|uniref:RNase H type-1 domain-containing protein n=1 Tax=Gossypium arboreum TaxID=29729 RepID=A0ABR0NH42_GOSAR|nr:hypothetical protein PVK06_035547 [Gossypium arboreum]
MIVHDSFDTEARAAVHALKFANNLGFTSIKLEGDSKMVIQKLADLRPDRSNVRAIIADGKALALDFNVKPGQLRFYLLSNDKHQLCRRAGWFDSELGAACPWRE